MLLLFLLGLLPPVEVKAQDSCEVPTVVLVLDTDTQPHPAVVTRPADSQLFIKKAFGPFRFEFDRRLQTTTNTRTWWCKDSGGCDRVVTAFEGEFPLGTLAPGQCMATPLLDKDTGTLGERETYVFDVDTGQRVDSITLNGMDVMSDTINSKTMLTLGIDTPQESLSMVLGVCNETNETRTYRLYSDDSVGAYPACLVITPTPTATPTATATASTPTPTKTPVPPTATPTAPPATVTPTVTATPVEECHDQISMPEPIWLSEGKSTAEMYAFPGSDGVAPIIGVLIHEADGEKVTVDHWVVNGSVISSHETEISPPVDANNCYLVRVYLNRGPTNLDPSDEPVQETIYLPLVAR